RGVGIGGGVDHYAVKTAVGRLDFIHQSSFVVGLKLLHRDPQGFSGLLQNGQELLKGLLAVDIRLPDTQHIDIGAVQYQNFNAISSCVRIWERVSSKVLFLSTILSAKASYKGLRRLNISSRFPAWDRGRPSVGRWEI